MATLKRYMQLVLMIAAIAVLYSVPLDWAIPYVLPITIVGVVAILSFVFFVLKRRGLMAFVLIGLLAVSTQVKAYDIIDCPGSYKTSQSLIANAITAVQDSVLEGGNVTTSDFEDENVYACVVVNIISLHSDICGAVSGVKDTYDPKVRAKVYYVIDNYKRMSYGEATNNVDNDYISDLVKNSGNQALINAHAAAVKYGEDNNISEHEAMGVFNCANEYNKKAAKIDRKNETNCGTVMNKVKANSKDCWVCDLVYLIVEAVQLMAGNTYQLMQSLAFKLLGVIFLFWIALKVLIFIGHMGYADNGEFMTEMLIRLIVVAIAAAILNAPIVDFYRVVISPFVGLSASLAGKFTEMSMTDGERTFAEIVESRANADTSDICTYCTNMNDPDFEFERQTSQENSVYVQVMDDQTINGILCLTCKVYRQVTPFIAVGEMFTCQANADAIRVPMTTIYIPNIFYLLVGYAIIIPFSVLAAIIGFYVIDIVLRLGFVIVLTPLYITAWAFPISREYSTKAWHVILFSLLQFLGVAVMVALFSALCLQIIPGGTPENLLNAMANNDIEKMFNIVTGIDSLSTASTVVATGTSIGPFFLIFLFAGFLFIAIKMLTSTEAIVSNLSGISLGIPGVALGVLATMVKQAISMSLKSAGIAGQATSKVAEKLDKESKGGGDKSLGDTVKEVGYKSARFSDKETLKFISGMGVPQKFKGMFNTAMQGKAADKDKGANTGGSSNGAGTGGSSNSGSKAVENTANSTAKGVEQTTNATSKALTTAGTAIGQSGRAAGQAMAGAGKGLTATVIGAPVGVALMAAGAATAAAATLAELTLKAAAVTVKAAGKAAAAAVKVGGKAAAIGMMGAKKGMKVAQNGMKKVAQTGAKATSKVAQEANKVRKNVQKNVGQVAKQAKDSVNQEIDKNQQIDRNINQGNQERPQNNSDDKK